MITSRSSGSKESKEWEGFLGKDGRLVVVVVFKKKSIYLFDCSRF